MPRIPHLIWPIFQDEPERPSGGQTSEAVAPSAPTPEAQPIQAAPASTAPIREEPMDVPPEIKPIKPAPIRPMKVKSSPLPTVLIPPCADGQIPEQPETGERIAPDEGTSGESTLEVTNGATLDAVLRLLDSSSNRTSRLVYIRAMNVYTIRGIEPGTYDAIFESGSDWVPTCVGFLHDSSVDEFDEPLIFQQGISDDEHSWTEGSVTLNPVPQGNAKIHKVDRKRFLQGDQHFSLGSGGPKQ